MIKKMKSFHFSVLISIFSVLCLLTLTICLSFVWRTRKQSTLLTDCTLIADAACRDAWSDYKSYNDLVRKWNSIGSCRQVLISWAMLNSDMDEEEALSLIDNYGLLVDAGGYMQNDHYAPLFGDLSEEEFRLAFYSGTEDPQINSLSGVLPSVKSVIADDTNYLIISFSQSGSIVVLRNSYLPEESFEPGQTYLDGSPDKYIGPNGGGLAVVDLESGLITGIQGTLDASVGDSLTDLPGENGYMRIGSTNYIAAYSDKLGYRFISAVPMDQHILSASALSFTLALCFTLVFLITSLYGFFLRRDIMLGKISGYSSSPSAKDLQQQHRKRVRLMFLTFFLLCCLLVVLIATLSIIDNARINNSRMLERIKTYYLDAKQESDYHDLGEDSYYHDYGELFSDLVSAHPELMEDDCFSQLSLVLRASFFIISEEGKVEHASVSRYDLSGLFDESSDWYPLTSVLYGRADNVIAQITENDSTYVAVAVRRKDTGGMILLRIDSIIGVEADYFSNYKLLDGYLLLVASQEQDEMYIISSSDSRYTGMTAASIGLDDDVMVGDFVGERYIDGKPYFITSLQANDLYCFMAVRTNTILFSHLLAYILTIAAGFLCTTFLLYLEFLFYKEELEQITITLSDDLSENPPSEEYSSKTLQSLLAHRKISPKNIKENLTHVLHHDREGLLIGQADPFEYRRHTKNIHQKLNAEKSVKLIIHLLIVLFTVILYFQSQYAPGISSSVVSYLFSKQWSRTLNIYSVSYALISLLFIYTFVIVVRYITKLIGKNFGSRGSTIIRLFDSFFGYLSVLAAIAYLLSLIGVNTTTILTSVGIVGLGLSLGAKDLITDILAGLSIVIEGEFQQNDIIMINGSRGVVLDIGIRTTKISCFGNIRIFRNSEVTGVINLTQHESYAFIEIKIMLVKPYEEIEKMILENLPEIQKNVPQTLTPIMLVGIQKVQLTGAILRFASFCNEIDRFDVERAMLRQAVLLMERESIPVSGGTIQG